MKIHKILIFGIFCLTFLSAAAQTAADKILGTYYISDDQSDEDCKIKIYKTSSGTYEGRIIWVKHPYFKDGSLKHDINNPDPSKRNTPGDKIQLLFHFKYSAKENKWVDGEIYDPVHGKYYKSKMWFESDKTLRVRGYIGVPALGRTMTWKKL
ncbi:MAG: DUF2147 domain-containing protein [Bacteroidales bacterium]|nr:DUF2147 domain-containing protein [Bacteroidales bacterium]